MKKLFSLVILALAALSTQAAQVFQPVVSSPAQGDAPSIMKIEADPAAAHLQTMPFISANQNDADELAISIVQRNNSPKSALLSRAGDDDQWSDIGECEYLDPFVTTGRLFSNLSTPLSYVVPIQEKVGTPGYYRLVAPYGTRFAEAFYATYDMVLESDTYDSKDELYLEIDARDPNKVIIPYQETGLLLNRQSGQMYVFNYATYLSLYKKTQPTEKDCGSMQNGVITLPAGNAIAAFKVDSPNDYANKIYQTNKASAFNMLTLLEYGWQDWQEFGSLSFSNEFVNNFKANMNNFKAPGQTLADWDGSAKVYHRVKTDGSAEQIRLDGVFNNNSVKLDCDPVTHVVSAREQSIGVKINPAFGYPYSDFRFGVSTGGSYYFPASGKLTINVWFYVADGLGLNFGLQNLKLDNVAPLDFKIIPHKNFISSTDEPRIDIDVKRSSNLNFVRVVRIGFYETLTYDAINQLMEAKPAEGAMAYTDYDVTDNKFSIEIPDEGPTRYTFYFLPFDADGEILDTFQGFYVFSNRQLDYEWTPLGTAIMSDIIGHLGLPMEEYIDPDNGYNLLEPQMREVEIDVRADAPGVYRIRNPFGKAYPMCDMLTETDANDDFYMFVDATDPSRVNVTLSLAGFNIDQYPATLQSTNYINLMTGMTSAGMDMNYGNKWGKLIDRRISFPLHSVFASNSHIKTSIEPFDLEILLPGYEAYPMSWINETPDEDGNIALDLGNEKITKVLAALVPDAEVNGKLNFTELLFAQIAADPVNSHAVTYDVAGGEALIKISELEDLAETYGVYRIVAVQLDADGVEHGGLVGATYKVAAPDDLWVELGDAIFEENIVLEFYGFCSLDKVNKVTCKVMENLANPGLYKLINPYEVISTNNVGGNIFAYIPTDIFIDATNPDRVNFVVDNSCVVAGKFGVPTGLTVESYYGPSYINTLANVKLSIDVEPSDSDYGKKVDNVITFEGNVPVDCLPEINYFHNNDEGLVRITLPSSAGFDDAISDVDAKPEYFNLQGVKVANPSGGIFIERRGSKVVKRLIP